MTHWTIIAFAGGLAIGILIGIIVRFMRREWLWETLDQYVLSNVALAVRVFQLRTALDALERAVTDCADDLGHADVQAALERARGELGK